MSPRLLPPEGEDWLLSTDAERREVIASVAGRVALATGDAAQRLLAGQPPAEVLGAQGVRIEPRLSWEAEPRVLSDVEMGPATGLYAGVETLRAALPPTGHVYVVCARHPAALLELLASRPGGAALTPVLLYGNRVIAGPTFQPRGAPCTACWATLVRANLPSLAARLQRQHELLPPPAERVAQLFLAVRAFWEAPRPAEPRDRALVWELGSGELRPARVLPAPGCVCTGDVASGSLSDLLDETLGYVHTVSQPTGASVPLTLLTAQSRVFPEGSGAACALDPANARRRALAESVERLSAFSPPGLGAPRAPHDVPHGVTLETLNFFSAAQLADEDFAYQALDARTPVRWLSGTRWEDGLPVSLPAQLVSLVSFDDEPALRSPISTGIAAGPSWTEAATSALLELVERDVITRSWFSGAALRLSPDELAPAETARIRGAGLNVELALCDSPTGVPVAVAFVAREGTRGGGYGFGASFTVPGAARHALEEACLTLANLEQRDALLPRSPQWESLPAAPPGTLARSAPLAALVNQYQPCLVDLTGRHARAVGVRVVSAWSPVAVDLPRPGHPLQLGRFVPSSAALEAIEKYPVHR